MYEVQLDSGSHDGVGLQESPWSPQPSISMLTSTKKGRRLIGHALVVVQCGFTETTAGRGRILMLGAPYAYPSTCMM